MLWRRRSDWRVVALFAWRLVLRLEQRPVLVLVISMAGFVAAGFRC